MTTTTAQGNPTKKDPAPSHTHTHHHTHHNRIYPHVAVIFACLSVVLLKYENQHIPFRDIRTAMALTVYAAIITIMKNVVSVLFHKKEETLSHHPETTTRETFNNPNTRIIMSRLMRYEVFWTILVPWCLLIIDHHRNNEEGVSGAGNDDGSHQLAYLLVPHLFFFQVQILLEVLLQLSNVDVFWYTVLANAGRWPSILTWLQRTVSLVLLLQQKDDGDGSGGGGGSTNTDMMVVVAISLPVLVAATCLWCYSSFVFIPRIWYPDRSSSSTN